jgi:hypothetical protein
MLGMCIVVHASLARGPTQMRLVGASMLTTRARVITVCLKSFYASKERSVLSVGVATVVTYIEVK